MPLPPGPPTQRPDTAEQRRQYEAALARQRQADAEERERRHARLAERDRQRVADLAAKAIPARVRAEAETLERIAKADLRGAIAAGDTEGAMAAATRALAARLVITNVPSE